MVGLGGLTERSMAPRLDGAVHWYSTIHV